MEYGIKVDTAQILPCLLVTQHLGEMISRLTYFIEVYTILRESVLVHTCMQAYIHTINDIEVKMKIPSSMSMEYSRANLVDGDKIISPIFIHFSIPLLIQGCGAVSCRFTKQALGPIQFTITKTKRSPRKEFNLP